MIWDLTRIFIIFHFYTDTYIIKKMKKKLYFFLRLTREIPMTIVAVAIPMTIGK